MYWVVRVEDWAVVEECGDNPMEDCPGQRAYFRKEEAEETAARINDTYRAYRKLVGDNYTPAHL